MEQSPFPFGPQKGWWLIQGRAHATNGASLSTTSYMTYQILSRTFTDYIIHICDPNLRTAKATNLELSMSVHMLTNEL